MNVWTGLGFLLQNSPGSAVVDLHHFPLLYGAWSHRGTPGDVSEKANRETLE